MKKKLLASALLACSLVTLGAISAARAEPLTPGTTVLETVDGSTTMVDSSFGQQVTLRVEGIVQGESEARELDLQFSTSTTSVAIQERCLKLMLLAQTHPGRYTLEIKTVSATSRTVNSCKLKSR